MNSKEEKMGYNEEFLVLRNFLGKVLPKKVLNEVCSELAISPATFYRRLKKLENLPVASTLKPSVRGL